MQSTRRGGYGALPIAVRKVIAQLTTKTDKRGNKRSTTSLVWLATPIIFPAFVPIMLAFTFAPFWGQEWISLSLIPSFSEFGFYLKHDAWSGLLGLFMGGALGYAAGVGLILLLPNANRVSAHAILYTQLSQGDANSDSNRRLQDYVLDRTPASDPRTFPKRYTRQYVRVVWLWCRPALLIYAVWGALDVNTYKVATIQGMTSSSFLEIGSTKSEWDQVNHVQVGCYHAFEGGEWITRPRYQVYFSNGRTIDLFEAEHVGDRLAGVEMVDGILRRTGVGFREAHIQKKLFKQRSLEMQIECESAVFRSRVYDPLRVQTLLRTSRENQS